MRTMTAPVSSFMHRLASREVSGSPSVSGSHSNSYTCYNQSTMRSRALPLLCVTMSSRDCDVFVVLVLLAQIAKKETVKRFWCRSGDKSCPLLTGGLKE